MMLSTITRVPTQLGCSDLYITYIRIHVSIRIAQQDLQDRDYKTKYS